MILVVVWAWCAVLPVVLVKTNAMDVHDSTSTLHDADPSPTPQTATDGRNSGSSPMVKRSAYVHKKSTLPKNQWSYVTEDGQSRPKFEVPSQILTLAGNRQPICRSVLQSVTPKQENYLSVIQKSIQSMVHLEDVTLLGFLSVMTVPMGQSIYEWLPSIIPQYNNAVEFRKTIYYEIVDHIQQIARIVLAIYCSDIIKLIILGLGFKIPGMISTTATDGGMPHAFAHIVYTIWIANRIGYVNRKLLRRYINTHPESFGRINLIQKWIDAIIYAATVVLVMHILKVESGVAINRSFLAVGSVGTLAFGLASQGIATQVINGLLLASSDRIYEGDDVMLSSNGFAGNIVKLGWLETVIRGRYVLLVFYKYAAAIHTHCRC
jgi:hypothetical protein